ncbi:MAG TPA: hypothetical protein VF753_02955 [Terriglobales bacterium]
MLIMAADKERAHELINRMTPTQVAAVVTMIETLLDPVSRAIASAPVDDEPLTAEEEKALDESLEWLKHNKGIPHEQVLAEFGIKKDGITRSRKRK